MTTKIKIILFSIIRKVLKKKGYALDDHANVSFSQTGEDMIVQQIFRGKKDGYYVDVGAFHPKLYSNTYIFYLQGWHGINIDPMPGSMELFGKIRPRDLNLEIAIAKTKKRLTYFLFNHPAVNSFIKPLSEKRDKEATHKIIGKQMLKTYTLAEVFKKYLPKKQVVDFLSVDTEGMDLEVLQSNDWGRYRPQVIVVEDLDFLVEQPHKSKIYNYLLKKGYYLLGKTSASLIFMTNS